MIISTVIELWYSVYPRRYPKKSLQQPRAKCDLRVSSYRAIL